jgi:hypothetical protein
MNVVDLRPELFQTATNRLVDKTRCWDCQLVTRSGHAHGACREIGSTCHGTLDLHLVSSLHILRDEIIDYTKVWALPMCFSLVEPTPPTRGVGFAIWRCVGYGGSPGPRYRRAYRGVRWILDGPLPVRPKASAVIYTEDDHRFIED